MYGVANPLGAIGALISIATGGGIASAFWKLDHVLVDTLPSGLKNLYFHKFFQWSRTRYLSAHAFLRTTTIWLLPFTAGFAVGYGSVACAALATDVAIDTIEHFWPPELEAP
jgi:hypothetical protein